jgi:DUF1680 family protein
VRTWKKGDKITIDFPMPVRQIKANDKVMEDKGKLAIQRGPIIFCLEGHDQPDHHVLNKYIPENSTFQIEFDKNLLNGIVVLKGKAREVLEAGKKKKRILQPFHIQPGTTEEPTKWQYGFHPLPLTLARTRNPPLLRKQKHSL